ncbi:MAG: replication-associated recombination protein A [Candidatus Omnitrophica bacterium]|nr:replication-associated recombination protein A [Candidatus Omnitrophota bacterium]
MASRRRTTPSGESAGRLNLFPETAVDPKTRPLAARMRPRTLEEFVGQQHLLGEGKLLRRALKADRLASLILYGPPGTGKTALAGLVAARTQAHFERVNAVTSNVEEVRRIIEAARLRRRTLAKRTLLFIDEIHRFNKAQQDVLMPEVEEGVVILLGATTHNPFFSLVSPLLSRSLVVEFKPLSSEEIRAILQRAITDRERGLGEIALAVEPAALNFLIEISDGDARRALNGLEVAALTTPAGPGGKIQISKAAMEESVQKKAVVYDRDEDAHYDTISAYIKAMRGSDPDAALYWLAKMIYAGEDPRFIARRLVICAAEDVGNADPQALVVSMAAAQSVEFIGLPECRIPLALATAYVACAPKSNAAYMGLEKAAEDIQQGKTLEVPQHLKDAHYPGAKKLEHGEGYKYAHNYPGHHVEQSYLPEDRRYYEPTEEGFEKEIKGRMSRLKPRPSKS